MSLQNLATPSEGLYRSDLWYSNPNVPKYPHDVAKAKQLLADAGWTDSNNDGTIDKDGQEFIFELVTNQGNAQREQCAQIIKQNLKAVGIEMSIRIIEWSAFLEKFVNPRQFDAIILGWSMGPEPDQYNFWHSSQTGPTQFNFVSYFNDEVDDLLEKGRVTIDQDARKQIYYRLQEVIVDDAPYIWLYSPYALAAVRNSIHGISVAPAGIEYNFQDWWISPTQTP